MGELPLPVLLSRLAQELACLRHMASEMEAAVDELVERHPGLLDHRCIRNLQLLDIINQTLLALTAVTSNTALQSSPDWTVDGPSTLAGINLAGIAQRLSCGAEQHGTAETGSYELF